MVRLVEDYEKSLRMNSEKDLEEGLIEEENNFDTMRADYANDPKLGEYRPSSRSC